MLDGASSPGTPALVGVGRESPGSGDEGLIIRGRRRGQLPRLYPEVQKRKATQDEARQGKTSLELGERGWGGGGHHGTARSVWHGMPSHLKNTLESWGRERMDGQAGRYVCTLTYPVREMPLSRADPRCALLCADCAPKPGQGGTSTLMPTFGTPGVAPMPHTISTTTTGVPLSAPSRWWCVSVVCELHAR
jgi:hypothetical protein